MANQDKRLACGARELTGKLVAITHGDREFAVYVHLKPNSLRAQKGKK